MVSCEFSNRVLGDGSPATRKDEFFNFKNLTCSGTLDFSVVFDTSSVPVYLEKQNENFYLQKTFSLGEIVFLAVLIPAIFAFLILKIREFLKNKYQ